MVVTRRGLQQRRDENAAAPGEDKPKRKALAIIDANQQACAGEEPKAKKPGMLTRRGAAAAVAHPPAAAAQVRKERSPRPVRLRKPSVLLASVRPQQQAAACQPVARRTRAKRAAGAVQAGVSAIDAGAATAPGVPAVRGLKCPHDIDAADAANPLAASGYVQHIYEYLKRMEPVYRIDPDYIRRQPDINPKMRAILVDWLIDVSLKFKLAPETLYLTTSYLDRFLQKRTVQRSTLQLVGITSLHIASKYEEVWAPQVRDYIYICDSAYDKDQILGMEKIMLSDLRFNLTVPTPYLFLIRLLKAADADQDVLLTNYAQYLCELSLTEVDGLKYPPSLLASAAVYTARVALARLPNWPEGCVFHSGYSEDQITSCAFFLARLFQGAPSSMLTTAFKKYSDSQRCCVSRAGPPIRLL